MRNLVLFLLFVSVATFTYFYEEIGFFKIKSEEDQIRTLLTPSKLGLLSEFKLKNSQLIKKNNRLMVFRKEYPVDMESFDQVIDYLKRLKVVRILEEKEVSKIDKTLFVPDDDLSVTLIFEKSQVIYTLGNPLGFENSFYLKLTKDNVVKWLVVKDIGALEGMYEKAKENEVRYERIKNLFLLGDDFFMDRTVHLSSIEISSALIKNTRNKKFEINFDKLTTLPIAPVGISYNEEFLLETKNFFSELSGIKLFYPYVSKNLGGEVARSVFIHKDGKDGGELILKLYNKYEDKEGYFLTSSQSEPLFELNEESAKYFFLNVQDFWSKIPFRLTSIPNDQNFDFTISFKNNGSHQLSLLKGDDFKIINLAGDESLKSEAFKDLFNFLGTEAHHLSEFDENDKDYRHDALIKLLIGKEKWWLIVNKMEIILVNETNKYKLHYFINSTFPIKLDYKDYFL